MEASQASRLKLECNASRFAQMVQCIYGSNEFQASIEAGA